MMYKRFIKRLLDIIISFISILILIPAFFIISIIVLIFMGKPILFFQDRIGKDEKIFRLYKFRSMTNEKDENGILLDEQKRLTKVGVALRSSSLDEIPELWSILKGDMSFVGPRPMPIYYGPYFLPEERKRHSVRGGLIPPDSLSGKTYTTYEEQFQYELYYVNHISFLLDIKVIFTTISIILNRVKTNYGSGMDRPHLNVYRANLYKDISKESYDK